MQRHHCIKKAVLKPVGARVVDSTRQPLLESSKALRQVGESVFHVLLVSEWFAPVGKREEYEDRWMIVFFFRASSQPMAITEEREGSAGAKGSLLTPPFTSNPIRRRDRKARSGGSGNRIHKG